MLFQPAIIALLLASAVGVLMLLASAPFALRIIARWDIRSGSEAQLALERGTYLLSTVLSFIFAVQLAKLLLFVFTADRLAVMFVGAMCAVGTLNVNEYGFPALLGQILVFFLAAMWLAINHVDAQARDYPLVRIKYLLLLALLPVLAFCFGLEFQYFRGLKANVITSCCGSLFSAEGKGLSGEASAMAAGPAMLLFYPAQLLAVAAAVWQWRRPGRWAAYATALGSAIAFVAAISGVLAFVSLYIYEHPHHHCPFCILKSEYAYQGYALYLPLFVAAASGLAVGAIQPFARVASLQTLIPRFSRRLAAVAALGFMLFAALSTYHVMASNLILFER